MKFHCPSFAYNLFWYIIVECIVVSMSYSYSYVLEYQWLGSFAIK